MAITGILFILAAYLIGSIPTAYLAGKLYRGVDIRHVGTGTAGGSNVWQTVSRPVSVAVAFADACKGFVVIIVSRLLHLDLPSEAAGAVAVIAGHNWSVFLRFNGGRGVATMTAVLLLMAPRDLVIAIIPVLVSMPVKQMALGVIIGVVALPVVSLLWHDPLALTLGCLGILVMIVAGRLIANWSRPAEYSNAKLVLLYRFLFDRDTRDRESWVKRGHSGIDRDEAKT